MSSQHINEFFTLALAHQQAGRWREAEQSYREILQRDPLHADSYHMLGVLKQQSGDGDLGIELIQKAISLQPQKTEYYGTLGVILAVQGRRSEAIEVFRHGLSLRPDDAQLLYSLGKALKDTGQLAEAITAFETALRIRPDLRQAYNNLGNALQQIGRIGDAVSVYRRALPLGYSSAEIHSNLGSALQKLGELGESANSFRQAIALKPQYAEAYNNLGTTLQAMGHFREAADAFRQAIALRPDSPDFYNNLGGVLRHSDQLDESIAAYQMAVKLRPDFLPLHRMLADTLKTAGRLDEAMQCLRNAPPSPHVDSDLLYAMHLRSEYDRRRLYEEHVKWDLKYARPLGLNVPPHANDRSPDRPLRVGYVAYDIGNHPLGRLLLPLVENHDRRQFDIYCYGEVWGKGWLAHRMAELVERRDTGGISDDVLARQIRQDRIDILVDLQMHVPQHRLLTFARKPAPVQATYLAYPGTTGLSAIDYRLTDPYIDPLGSDDSVYSEKSVRLPHCFWCYAAPPEAPAVESPPALMRGHITFGSMNAFWKMNPAVYAAWGQLLKLVPDSRLLLSCPSGDASRRVKNWFSQLGLGLERLELVPRVSLRDYFAGFNQFDISLDVFPYPGGTATMDSLWMGVPVITLAGETAISRGGLSILSNLGLEELITHNADEYVKKAVALSQDCQRITELRRTLRERMLASPLMNTPQFARDVEAAYRMMWRDWCS